MMNRFHIASAALVLLFAGFTTAGVTPADLKPAATQPATQPSKATTQPIDPKLQALVNQLGDDNPHKRDEATAGLRKLGNDALPALRAASNDDDPQIRTSAQALITQITEKDKPVARADEGFPGEIFVGNGGGIVLHNVRIEAGAVGNARVQIQMRVANGRATRDVTANENGRKVHIHEDNDGLNMQITDNGETKEYKAKNADELKEKEPEAYKTFEKYTQRAGGRIQIQVAPPKE